MLMKKSLQRHLSLMLGVTIALAGFIAAIASFSLAYSEAKELQDDMLRQIAVLAVGSQNKSAHADTSAGDGALSDPESRVMVIHLPGDSRPVWLTDGLPAGFHTLTVGAEQLRVFVRDNRHGERTVVAQPTEVRDEIAINSALRTLLPLVALLPLLAWLVAHIIRRELVPITRLARVMDEQQVDRPQPLNAQDIPQEIAPFVHAINRLLARVNQLMEQQRRFIADAAHELRSPLTALAIQTQNMMHADTLPAMRDRAVPLQAGIERARQLTEQLLNLARTQTGTGCETLVNVSEMTRELIAQHLGFAEARHIDLGLEVLTPVTLRVEANSLRMLIKNALENALKYTPAGGEVTIRLCSDKTHDIIEILDNGPGIPVSERERVFDPFYRISGSAGEGNGLGLAIAREAALRLSGTISLHDRSQGAGLIFRYQQQHASR